MADAGSREGEPAVLSVDRVSKAFGAIEVLRNVSISLGAREIRALCGENGAGKSTLIKILTGVYQADRGAIALDGLARDIRQPQQAQELGIAVVAQELSLAPALSVEDNIWLGNRTVPLFHRRRALRERARRALDAVGLTEIALDTRVAALGIGQRQLVELARMLTREARVLILDEPTATLSDADIERIFRALRALRAQGKSIIYVTHRLGEVFEICDSVTVLRNGELIGTAKTRDIDREHLMEMMLGRPIGEMYPRWQSKSGTPMLVVDDLRVPGLVHGFNLVAEQGVMVAIAGQVGSGAGESLRALAGLIPNATGRMTVRGAPVALRSVARAQAGGVQFISEDRAHEGIFLRLPVRENLVATHLDEHSRLGVLDRRGLWAAARAMADAAGIDPSRLRSRADDLSGGNQQKVAFGRAIGGQPGILLMHEPTRGVDVGARAEIYRLMRSLCDRGYTLVMASSDLEEALGISDAVVTMYRGRQVGRYTREQASMHRVLADITHPAAAA